MASDSGSDHVSEMIPGNKFHTEKWRPSLGMVVTAMLIFILMLPLGSIWIFRFYDSQLVRSTENELIAQGAFVKAMLQAELKRTGFDGNTLPKDMAVEPLQESSIRWIEPQLDLTQNTILPPRPEGRLPQSTTQSDFVEAGKLLTTIITNAQKTTLAGFRVLDPYGTVIAGGNEIGLSLAHIGEVKDALAGKYASAIRTRTSESARPPIYSISRGTDIRIFVAMPIDYENRVAGVVYLSRTPSHFLRELYGQRWKLGGAFIFLLLVTLAIAALFVRTIKGPIDALNDRTRRISNGDRTAISPLARHGTREIADLSHGLLSMSQQLQGRTDYIRNFASHVSHELKSPITSIHGAAELMNETSSDMSDMDRKKFLENIMGDTSRMASLLERLRELAAAEQPHDGTGCNLTSILENLSLNYPGKKISIVGPKETEVILSDENTQIVFENLIGNSVRHSAANVSIEHTIDNQFAVVEIQDDGTGISDANRDKVFDLFFTTERDDGGTGMGLNIIRSILHAHGGSIELLDSESGTHFKLLIPLAATKAS